MVEFEKLNTEVGKWAKETSGMMAAKVASLSNSSKHDYIKYKQTLAGSVKSKVTKRFEVAERIVFPFNKYGFFLSTGASRGHKAQSNPRQKKDWYGFVFESRFETLADIVANNYADATINHIGMLLEEKYSSTP